MSVRLRLQRHGSKKRPFYRVVAADQRAPRDGRFIELLGTYDPHKDPVVVRLKRDRVDYWLKVGAQPSDTARWLIKKLHNGEAIDLSQDGAEDAANQALRNAKTEAIEAKRQKAATDNKTAAEAAKKAADEAKAAKEAEAKAAADAKAAEEAETKAAEEAKDKAAKEAETKAAEEAKAEEDAAIASENT